MSASFCDCVNQWEQAVGLQVLKDTKYLSVQTRGGVETETGTQGTVKLRFVDSSTIHYYTIQPQWKYSKIKFIVIVTAGRCMAQQWNWFLMLIVTQYIYRLNTEYTGPLYNCWQNGAWPRETMLSLGLFIDSLALEFLNKRQKTQQNSS